MVFSYLRETVRVLKPGGFARLQINGLPKTAKAYTTWEGVRISADEIHDFTREQGVRLLSLTGVETQYMWTTWQKPPRSRHRTALPHSARRERVQRRAGRALDADASPARRCRSRVCPRLAI